MTDFIKEGKYKIIMPLGEIPEFTHVTTPAGRKVYEIKHSLPVHAEYPLSKQIEVKVPDECIFLTHSGGVDIEYPEKEVAIHFDTFGVMSCFIQVIEERKEEDEEC